MLCSRAVVAPGRGRSDVQAKGRGTRCFESHNVRAPCHRYDGQQRGPGAVDRGCERGSRTSRVLALARTTEGAGADVTLEGSRRILVGKRLGGSGRSREHGAGFARGRGGRIERHMEMRCEYGQGKEQPHPSHRFSQRQVRHEFLIPVLGRPHNFFPEKSPSGLFGVESDVTCA